MDGRIQVLLDAESASTAVAHHGAAQGAEGMATHLLVWGDHSLVLSGRVAGRPIGESSDHSLAQRTSWLFADVDLGTLDELRGEVRDRQRTTGARAVDALIGDTRAAALAKQLAWALSGPVSVLGPGTVVLAGPRFGPLSPVLAPMVEREMAELGPTRPRVHPTTVPGDTVLVGTMCHALAQAREKLIESVNDDAVERRLAFG